MSSVHECVNDKSVVIEITIYQVEWPINLDLGGACVQSSCVN